MKRRYLRLYIGFAVLAVALFLNFHYAYGGYGIPEHLAARSAALPDDDSDEDDTDDTCETGVNGEKYVCNSRIEIKSSITTCYYYTMIYSYSKEKQWDIEHEGQRYEIYDRTYVIEVKPDNMYDDWTEVCRLESADLSKLTPDNVPLNVVWNNVFDLSNKETIVSSGTKTMVSCHEGGEENCLPGEDVHCAEWGES